MKTDRFDLGIHARRLMTYTSSPSAPVLSVRENVFVGVKGTRFALIEDGDGKHHDCDRRIEAEHHALLPGLVNAHTHLPMSLFRGLADDSSIREWLFETVFPLEAKFANPEFCRIGTELSLLEMISTGTTTVGEMYFNAEAVAETIDRVGVRAVMGPEIKELPHSLDASESFEKIARLREKYRGHPRIEIGFGPHAPYTISDETFKRLALEANPENAPILIHVAEGAAEITDSIRIHGKTPVRRLYDLGLLRKRTVLAHGIHLSDDDRKLLVETGASIVHNPDSNMKLASGVAGVVALLKMGVAVGLGTDGAASNNDLSLFREMDSAAKLQKLTLNDPVSMGAKDAFYIATLGGPRALGLDEKIGTIEEGKEADFCLVDLQYPHLQPVYDLPSTLVYAATGMEVTHTAVAGKLLFDEKRPITLEKTRIFSEVERVTQAVKLHRKASHPVR